MVVVFPILYESLFAKISSHYYITVKRLCFIYVCVCVCVCGENRGKDNCFKDVQV